MRKVESDQKLLHLHAAIDQVNGEIVRPQHAAAVIERVRGNDAGLESFTPEHIGQQRVLARLRSLEGLPEFQNRNTRLLLLSAEFLERLEQGRQQMTAAG